MKMNKITKVLGALLLTGAVSGSAFAAENAAGVAEHFSLTAKSAKEAADAAAAGNKDGCLTAIKQTKQHYKELTGDAAGMPMQKAIKRLKEGQEECEKGDTAAATPILQEVAATIERIRTTGK
jgi:hypothetical protein